MWLITLFDLPADTAEARKAYMDFRKSLLQDGFSMLQYSVYARYCPRENKAKVHRGRIRKRLPPDGEVRIVSITDVHFAKMQIFEGKRRRGVEQPPEQIEMF